MKKLWWPALCSLGGCISAGLYASPETNPPGGFDIDLAAEAWHFHREVAPDEVFNAPLHRQDDGVSLIPTVIARLGVAEGVDVGLGLVRADLKLRLWHGRAVTLAVDPIARAVYSQDAVSVVGELPILVGYRPTHGLELAANAGVGVIALDGGDGTSQRTLLRAGLAMRVHLHGSLWLAPEVAYLGGVTGRTTRWLSGGIALHIEGPR